MRFKTLFKLATLALLALQINCGKRSELTKNIQTTQKILEWNSNKEARSFLFRKSKKDADFLQNGAFFEFQSSQKNPNSEPDLVMDHSLEFLKSQSTLSLKEWIWIPSKTYSTAWILIPSPPEGLFSSHEKSKNPSKGRVYKIKRHGKLAPTQIQATFKTLTLSNARYLGIQLKDFQEDLPRKSPVNLLIKGVGSPETEGVEKEAEWEIKGSESPSKTFSFQITLARFQPAIKTTFLNLSDAKKDPTFPSQNMLSLNSKTTQLVLAIKISNSNPYSVMVAGPKLLKGTLITDFHTRKIVPFKCAFQTKGSSWGKTWSSSFGIRPLHTQETQAQNPEPFFTPKDSKPQTHFKNLTQEISPHGFLWLGLWGKGPQLASLMENGPPPTQLKTKRVPVGCYLPYPRVQIPYGVQPLVEGITTGGTRLTLNSSELQWWLSPPNALQGPASWKKSFSLNSKLMSAKTRGGGVPKTTRLVIFSPPG